MSRAGAGQRQRGVFLREILTVARVKSGEEYIPLENLPKEEQRRLIQEQMDRAMEAVGYSRIKDGCGSSIQENGR